jgi:hypothetical protein
MDHLFEMLPGPSLLTLKGIKDPEKPHVAKILSAFRDPRNKHFLKRSIITGRLREGGVLTNP